jgi:hypothetical protein
MVSIHVYSRDLISLLPVLYMVVAVSNESSDSNGPTDSQQREIFKLFIKCLFGRTRVTIEPEGRSERPFDKPK